MAAQTPKYQFIITFDFGDNGFPDVQQREVYPDNFSRSKLIDKQNLDQGQIFYRRNYQGALTFTNSNQGKDFEFFRQIILSNKKCDICYLQINKWCSTSFVPLWNGSFSCRNANIDWDRCTFEIKPDTEDRYTCILKFLDTVAGPYVTDFPTETYVVQTRYEGIHFIELIEKLIMEIASGVTCLNGFIEDGNRENKLVSDFFEYNPIGDAIGYSVGNNYVTGGTNYWNMLYIYDKGNVIDPDATNPSIFIKEFTLKKAFIILREMFQVYWDITDSGDFRLEHFSFFQQTMGLDLTDPKYAAEMKAMNKHGLIDGQIPQKETYEFMEAANEDFVGKPIEYNTNCVNRDSDSIKEHRVEGVTTDIEFIRDSTLPVIYTISYMGLSGGNFIPGTVIVDDYGSGPTGFGNVMADSPPPGLPDAGYLQLVSDVIKIHLGTTITGPGAVSATVTGVGARKQTNISKDGYVLMANFDDSGTIRCLVTAGVLSGSPVYNAPLSWANLHDAFHKVDRWYKEGMMNDVLTAFRLNKPTIKQTPVEIKICCDIFYYHPGRLVKTELGQKYLSGINARVLESSYDPLRDTLKLTLAYTY